MRMGFCKFCPAMKALNCFTRWLQPLIFQVESPNAWKYDIQNSCVLKGKYLLQRLFLTICKYSHLSGDGNLFSAFHFQSWILWILRSTVKPCIWLWDRVTAPTESRNLFWFRNSLGYMLPQNLVYFSRIWWAYDSIFFQMGFKKTPNYFLLSSRWF